jgi:hypothetical protein
MGDWFSYEVQEQWKAYAKTVWTHPAQNASNLNAVKASWWAGYNQGKESIDERKPQHQIRNFERGL